MCVLEKALLWPIRRQQSALNYLRTFFGKKCTFFIIILLDVARCDCISNEYNQNAAGELPPPHGGSRFTKFALTIFFQFNLRLELVLFCRSVTKFHFQKKAKKYLKKEFFSSACVEGLLSFPLALCQNYRQTFF